MHTMSNFDALIQDLVLANRILAHEQVVDAYGHVSARNPNDPKRYFISVSRSPGAGDGRRHRRMHLDGRPVRPSSARSISSASSMARSTRPGPR